MNQLLPAALRFLLLLIKLNSDADAVFVDTKEIKKSRYRGVGIPSLPDCCWFEGTLLLTGISLLQVPLGVAHTSAKQGSCVQGESNCGSHL